MTGIMKKTDKYDLVVHVVLVCLFIFCFLTISSCRKKSPVPFRNEEALSLVELYMDLKFPPSTQRISTCYSYDSSGCDWGVLAVIQEDELDDLFKADEWQFVSNRMLKSEDFPLVIDCRHVMSAHTIKWWDPDIRNLRSIYHKKSQKRTIKLFIETGSNGWVRVFAVMQALGGDIPCSAEKLFELNDEVDIQVGVFNEMASEELKKSKTKPIGFPVCDSHEITTLLREECGILFPDAMNSVRSATDEIRPGETVFLLRVSVPAGQVFRFMERFLDENEPISDEFEPFDRVEDERAEVERYLDVPAWYTESIKKGWRLKPHQIGFLRASFDILINDIYIDTSDSNEAIIYLNGKKVTRKSAFEDPCADANDMAY